MDSGSAIPPDWSPSGIVTLTTDFGLTDPYVGIMKGAILKEYAAARFVDLTHGVAPQDVRAAAWFLSKSWSWFPAGSVHLAVVDPGVGGERQILLAFHEGHAFLAPDNGLLQAFLPSSTLLWPLDLGRTGLPAPSHTFHGRDIFAPIAARLAAGTPPALGRDALQGVGGIEFPEAVRCSDGSVDTEILLVDHYGNLISGFCPGPEEADSSLWEVGIAGHLVPGAKTYGDVSSGDLLALLDSYGHIEVAQRDGSAAQVLGVGPGEPMTVTRKSN
jgi:S-adenosylmethionine hydrolase